MRPDNYCHICKGTRKMCGLDYCPLLSKLGAMRRGQESLGKKDIFGESAEVFVGSFGYPSVSWGPVLPLKEYAGEREMYEMGYEKIIEHRVNVVRGKRYGGIRPEGRMAEETQDVAMSVRPVDVEMRFSKEPVFSPTFSSVAQPIGASGTMKDVRLCENPKVPKKADELLHERAKAREIATEMFETGLDNYYITKVLSAGLLGMQENRKMVPTRWSITATDDMLGKHLMERVRGYGEVPDFYVLSNESLSNHFEIIVMPGKWEFENFEAWAPGTIWTPGSDNFRVSGEYEPFGGRTAYADAQAGGYYAVRIGVLEFLDRIRRQARVVSIREIYEGYQIPVGVFQVRENVRDATLNVRKYSTLSEALASAGSRLRKGISEYVKRSKILRQRRLGEFF
ncbi:MAG: hypothetical protein AB1657_04470 [Candidatus Micrarchaeota archaeon]